MQVNSQIVIPSTSKKPRLELIKKFSHLHSTNAGFESEINKFANVIEEVEDVLLWWKNNKNNFPILAQLARIILAIPATSAPSERIFSVAGDILTKKRSSLSSFKLNYLIFIHENYKLLN